MKSATVPELARAARACSIHLSGCLRSCFSVFLRDPQPSTRLSRNPIFGHFLHYFSDLFVTTIGAKRCQNGSLKRAQNHTNLEKLLIKTPSWSRPAKRLRLEGAKPLNLTIITHFQLFFQRPRAPEKESKWSQNGASGHPKSQKIKKSGHSKKHRKTTLQKVGSWSHFDLKKGVGFRSRNVLKITKNPRYLPNGPPGLQNEPLGT